MKWLTDIVFFRSAEAKKTLQDGWRKLILITVPMFLVTSAARAGWNALSFPTATGRGVAVPDWISMVAILVCAAAALGWAALYVSWMRYSRDEFFGLDWTWRYSPTRKIVGVRAWCPVCNRQIKFSTGVMAALQSDNFLCRICSYDSFSRSSEAVPRKPQAEVIRRAELKRLDDRYGASE